MDPIAATFIVLALAVVAFAVNRIPLGVIAIGVALLLYFTGVLTLPESLAGFADPAVIFVAALFVVSESLESTGITAWAGQLVIGRAGTRWSVLLIVISALVAITSALISVTAAVAALLPLVAVVASRARIPPSKLMLPLAFAAHAGSMLLLTGTPVNILVSSAAAESGGRPFGFFEFAWVGVPLVIGTVLVMFVAARWLLPVRTSESMPLDLARHARLLREQYSITGDTAVLFGPSNGITEVVVAPRSPLIGATLTPGMATPSGDLVLLAARRGSDRMRGGSFEAQAGDTLLLQGSWEDLDRHASSGRVLPVDEPAALRRSVPLGRGAVRALVILGIMIVMLASGLVPPAVAALVAACLLVLTRTVSTARAYASVSWTTVVLIAGMIPLSTAFTKTGAAELVARGILAVVGRSAPTFALLVIAVLAVVLGQIISNTATVLILIPVAIAIAGTLDVSVQPFMMALTVTGAASFLTPIATPANLIVMKPAGYEFGDYWKLGLPLALFFIAIAVFYVPLIWPFALH